MKSEQLQIRVSTAQKAALKRRARAAGQDVSTYVLSRVLPDSGVEFERLTRALASGDRRSHAFAALNDLLTGLAAAEIARLPEPDSSRLTPLDRCLVAAMVEQAAVKGGVGGPEWLVAVEPLDRPHFTTRLRKLRRHLIRTSPAAFRRRNLFVDAALGDRV